MHLRKSHFEKFTAVHPSGTKREEGTYKIINIYTYTMPTHNKKIHGKRIHRISEHDRKYICKNKMFKQIQFFRSIHTGIVILREYTNILVYLCLQTNVE